MTRSPETDQEAMRKAIPMHERLGLRTRLRWLSWVQSDAAATRLFEQSALACIERVKDLPRDAGKHPFLIPRVPGTEETSRYWSAYMVLEHMSKVDNVVRGVVGALSRGIQPDVVVEIAAATPTQDAGPEQVEMLQLAVKRYLAMLSRCGKIDGAERHPHPWFGSLNAREWHRYAALHHRVHLLQLERILSMLEATRAQRPADGESGLDEGDLDLTSSYVP